MNQRTLMILVGIVLVLGAGFYALGAIEQESQVRTVAEIQHSPDAHFDGSYVLVGFPEAASQRIVTDDGSVESQENALYRNQSVYAETWTLDGMFVISTITTSVAGQEDGAHHWVLQNVTRNIDTDEIVLERSSEWTTPATEIVFQIRAFEDVDNQQPIWATYDGILPEGVTPRPSQLTGSFRSDLDVDAQVWGVEIYTVGCSSKFLPEDQRHDQVEDEFGVEE